MSQIGDQSSAIQQKAKALSASIILGPLADIISNIAQIVGLSYGKGLSKSDQLAINQFYEYRRQLKEIVPEIRKTEEMSPTKGVANAASDIESKK